MEIITSWKREGIEEGRAEGRAEGQQQEAAKFVKLMLEAKFGSLDESLESQIRSLSVEQLEKLGTAIFGLSTIDEVRDCLNEDS